MRKITFKILSVILIFAVIITGAPLIFAENSKLIIYPEYDSRISRDYDYSVSVSQGNTKPVTIPVYNRSNSATLFTDRLECPDYNRRFCEFAFSGEQVVVNITPHMDFSTYSVMPSAKKFKSSFSNGIISVVVENPDEIFMLKLDNDDNKIISVFADAEEKYDFDRNDPSVLYIDDKWTECSDSNTLSFYETSNFVKSLNSNGDTVINNKWGGKTPVTTLYIAPGSVLDARIFTWYPGITICGHGLILDPYSNIFETDITKAERNRSVVIESKDCKIKDVKIIDSQQYNLVIGTYGNNCDVNNIKILSETITSDGISIFGADDVKIKNNFIYCGDNALVFGNRNNNNIYENNIIGTTCAAFCPQENLPYELSVKDNYVFRCDEGCINYWYCSSETTVKNVIFDGLDCVDVKNIPWLFSTHDSGYGEKNFSFKNISVRNVRGHKTLTYDPTGKVIDLNTRSSIHKDSGNYNIKIENLFVDGIPVTSYKNLKIYNPVPQENNVSVTYNGSLSENVSLTPFVSNADYIYPYKVYIGKSLQEMKTQPVYKNSIIYLPFDEICDKLHYKSSKPSGLVNIDGVDMIDIDSFSAIISPIKYDKNTGSVLIENINDYTTNLLTETSSSFSRWVEDAAYQADLTTRKENGTTVYRIHDLVNNGKNGVFTFLTDAIKKNGPAKYHLTFTAKSVSGEQQTGIISLIDRNNLFKISQSVSFNNKSNNYSVIFDINANTDVSKIVECYLQIKNDGVGKFDIEVKDISLTIDEYNSTVSQGSLNCSCNCHKSGFMGFIYMIQRFFWKLFGTNKFCKCGVAHY